MNDELDDLLAKALARTEPSPDFSAKVMARVGERKALPWRPWLAVAASVAIAVTGWSGFREQRSREHEQQLLFALELASQKIAVVDQRLKKSSVEIRVREDNFERR